jgi:hydroxyacylglutathione hydrolase
MLSVHPFVFGPVEENTYIIANENNDCLIIDPGCYFEDELVTLISFIKMKGLQPVQMLLTHCHFDHIFGMAALTKAYNLTPQMHEQETPVLENAANAAQKWQLLYNDDYKGPFHYINEGDKIKMGDDELLVLNTPGHSPGSISFYSEANRFIVSGDVLFANSIGRTDLPGADTQTLLQSIQQKLFTLPDETLVLSGHGAPTTIGKEKKDNPFLKG